MSENDHKNGWYFIVFILVLVLGMWFSYPFWSYFYKDYFYNTEFSEMGVFGDSYGALNTLFSALAFTGIIASIYFQREELKATREELAMTRKEMEHQGDQFDAQIDALKFQVFENAFFSLLKLHLENTEAIIIRARSGLEVKGKLEIKELFNCYCDCQRENGEPIPVGIAYELFYEEYEEYVGSYFRTIFQVVKFIDSSEQSYSVRKRYVDVLMAQLSTHEVIMLFLHIMLGCKSSEVGEYDLMDGYDMLKNMSIGPLQRNLQSERVDELLTMYSNLNV